MQTKRSIAGTSLATVAAKKMAPRTHMLVVSMEWIFVLNICVIDRVNVQGQSFMNSFMRWEWPDIHPINTRVVIGDVSSNATLVISLYKS
jgi:hypothetical protein